MKSLTGKLINHLIRFVDEELSTQYFVAVEQIIHMEVSGILQRLLCC